MSGNASMKQVVFLTPEEGVRMNRDRLSELYRRFGDGGAEDVIARAAEALVLRMGKCQRLYQIGARAEMRRNLRSQIVISERIGMVSLAEAAGNVLQCLERDDPAALAATMARLLRIGERSVSELWELQDLSL